MAILLITVIFAFLSGRFCSSSGANCHRFKQTLAKRCKKVHHIQVCLHSVGFILSVTHSISDTDQLYNFCSVYISQENLRPGELPEPYTDVRREALCLQVQSVQDQSNPGCHRLQLSQRPWSCSKQKW